MPTALFSGLLMVVLAITVAFGVTAIETAKPFAIVLAVVFSTVTAGVGYALWITAYKIIQPETIAVSRSEIAVTRRAGVITVPWKDAGEPYATMRATGNVSSNIVVVPYAGSSEAQIIIEADDYAGSPQRLVSEIIAARDGKATPTPRWQRA